MPRRRTLIFDFDGTLADTLPRLVAISNRLAAEYGYRTIAEADIPMLRGKRSVEVLRWLRVPLIKIPAIARRFKAELYREIDQVAPTLTIQDSVGQLAAIYTLGIVTSNSVANVQRFLQTHDWPYFTFVRASAGLLGKSQVLKRLMRERKLVRAETLYIGDEVRDINAARACGLDTVAVSWGANHAERLAQAQPWALVHRPEELVQVITGNRGSRK